MLPSSDSSTMQSRTVICKWNCSSRVESVGESVGERAAESSERRSQRENGYGARGQIE